MVPSPPAPSDVPLEDAPSRVIAALILVGVLALATVAWIFDSNEDARTSRPESIETAAHWVRARFAAGDGVVTTPAWERGVFETLRGAGPGTEQFPFPALIVGEDPDPMTLLRMKRLWVIGAHGRPPTLPKVIEGLGVEEVQHSIDDGVTVARFGLETLTPMRSLTADFSTIVVERIGEAGARLCTSGRSRHRCGMKPWFDPHLEVRNVGRQEVEWIYTHPGQDGEPLRMTWKNAATSGWLVLRAGFTQAAVRHPDGGVTEVSVQIGDRIARLTLEPRKYGLGRIAIPLDTAADGHPPDVRIELRAQEHQWREVMMEADIVEALPKAVRTWLGGTIGTVAGDVVSD